MPNYVLSTLEKLQHPPPTKPQHSPHRHTSPNFGKQQQMVNPPDKSPKLSAQQTTHIQQNIDIIIKFPIV